MGLEIADTIEDLDESWPLNGDFLQQGDDHLRLVKNVLKKTLPGVNGNGFSKPITATEDELNYSSGVTSAIQTQIDAITSKLNGIVGIPIGGIIEYNGAFSSIPANFNLCDGTNGTPDMTNSFVYGTNTELELNQTGGSNDAAVIAHGHTFVGDALPPHLHDAVGSVQNLGSDSGSGLRYNRTGTTPTSSVSAGTPTGTIDTVGVSGTGLNRPAFVKLAYIRRMT